MRLAARLGKCHLSNKRWSCFCIGPKVNSPGPPVLCGFSRRALFATSGWRPSESSRRGLRSVPGSVLGGYSNPQLRQAVDHPKHESGNVRMGDLKMFFGVTESLQE